LLLACKLTISRGDRKNPQGPQERLRGFNLAEAEKAALAVNYFIAAGRARGRQAPALGEMAD